MYRLEVGRRLVFVRRLPGRAQIKRFKVSIAAKDAKENNKEACHNALEIFRRSTQSSELAGVVEGSPKRNLANSVIFRSLLSRFAQISPIEQNSLQLEPGVFIPGTDMKDLNCNLVLQSMLLAEKDSIEVFDYICRHLHHNLSNELLEVFLYKIITMDLLKLATTLLHVLSSKRTKCKFVMSNELWCLYISKVCEMLHYAGACLIYHDLLFNKRYSDACRGLHSNSIPFLISNATLRELATIYTHNKDARRVNGLLAYFKRFYSYSGHAETYKVLRICLVEAYSNCGDFAQAMDAFTLLAYIFKGHRHLIDFDLMKTYSKTFAFENFRWRRNNIKENANRISITTSDSARGRIFREEQEYAKDFNVQLFNPVDERNVYSRPKSPHIPLVEGVISRNDLPYFSALVKSNVESLKKSSKFSSLDNILNLLSSNHYVFHVFILSSLCELGNLNDAFQILTRLPKIYPKVHSSILLRPEDFYFLFFACINRLKNIEKHSKVLINENIEARKLQKLLLDLKTFYNEQGSACIRYSQKFNELYIKALLFLPSTTSLELLRHLDSALKNFKGFCLYLDQAESLKLSLLFDPYSMTKYERIICSELGTSISHNLT